MGEAFRRWYGPIHLKFDGPVTYQAWKPAMITVAGMGMRNGEKSIALLAILWLAGFAGTPVMAADIDVSRTPARWIGCSGRPVSTTRLKPAKSRISSVTPHGRSAAA
jgi:hypothetical protein